MLTTDSLALIAADYKTDSLAHNEAECGHPHYATLNEAHYHLSCFSTPKRVQRKKESLMEKRLSFVCGRQGLIVVCER